MERLFYNCEILRLSYTNDIDIKYSTDKSPTDDNTYLLIKTQAKQKNPGTLLHVYIDDIDKGLFIVDKNSRLVSITCGEQFYKPLYKAYEDLINEINKIGEREV